MQHLVLFLSNNINKHIYWIKNTAVGMLTNNNKKNIVIAKNIFLIASLKMLLSQVYNVLYFSEYVINTLKNLLYF